MMVNCCSDNYDYDVFIVNEINRTLLDTITFISNYGYVYRGFGHIINLLPEYINKCAYLKKFSESICFVKTSSTNLSYHQKVSPNAKRFKDLIKEQKKLKTN